MNRSWQIGLLTDSRYVAEQAESNDWYLKNILAEDRLLQRALQKRNVQSQRISWSVEGIDWSQFDACIFRTTWDYFDRFDQFRQWLAFIETQTQLMNPASTIRWNWDKAYLNDLRSLGFPIVETILIEAGNRSPLIEWFENLNCSQAVIKPCISGAARHTYRIDRTSCHQVDSMIQPLRSGEAFMIQPFQNAIQQQGEDTLILFEGKYSHAVKKIAKPDDFRVQDDFGGTVHPLQPTAEQIQLAEAIMARIEPTPIYGRVDLVWDNRKHWSIMELELIEPELWMRNEPISAERFAEGVVRSLEMRVKS